MTFGNVLLLVYLLGIFYTALGITDVMDSIDPPDNDSPLDGANPGPMNAYFDPFFDDDTPFHPDNRRTLSEEAGDDTTPFPYIPLYFPDRLGNETFTAASSETIYFTSLHTTPAALYWVYRYYACFGVCPIRPTLMNSDACGKFSVVRHPGDDLQVYEFLGQIENESPYFEKYGPFAPDPVSFFGRRGNESALPPTPESKIRTQGLNIDDGPPLDDDGPPPDDDGDIRGSLYDQAGWFPDEYLNAMQNRITRRWHESPLLFRQAHEEDLQVECGDIQHAGAALNSFRQKFLDKWTQDHTKRFFKYPDQHHYDDDASAVDDAYLGAKGEWWLGVPEDYTHTAAGALREWYTDSQNHAFKNEQGGWNLHGIKHFGPNFKSFGDVNDRVDDDMPLDDIFPFDDFTRDSFGPRVPDFDDDNDLLAWLLAPRAEFGQDSAWGFNIPVKDFRLEAWRPSSAGDIGFQVPLDDDGDDGGPRLPAGAGYALIREHENDHLNVRREFMFRKYVPYDFRNQGIDDISRGYIIKIRPDDDGYFLGTDYGYTENRPVSKAHTQNRAPKPGKMQVQGTSSNNFIKWNEERPDQFIGPIPGWSSRVGWFGNHQDDSEFDDDAPPAWGFSWTGPAETNYNDFVTSDDFAMFTDSVTVRAEGLADVFDDDSVYMKLKGSYDTSLFDDDGSCPTCHVRPTLLTSRLTLDDSYFSGDPIPPENYVAFQLPSTPSRSFDRFVLNQWNTTFEPGTHDDEYWPDGGPLAYDMLHGIPSPCPPHICGDDDGDDGIFKRGHFRIEIDPFEQYYVRQHGLAFAYQAWDPQPISLRRWSKTFQADDTGNVGDPYDLHGNLGSIQGAESHNWDTGQTRAFMQRFNNWYEHHHEDLDEQSDDDDQDGWRHKHGHQDPQLMGFEQAYVTNQGSEFIPFAMRGHLFGTDDDTSPDDDGLVQRYSFYGVHKFDGTDGEHVKKYCFRCSDTFDDDSDDGWAYMGERFVNAAQYSSSDGRAGFSGAAFEYTYPVGPFADDLPHGGENIGLSAHIGIGSISNSGPEENRLYQNTNYFSTTYLGVDHSFTSNNNYHSIQLSENDDEAWGIYMKGSVDWGSDTEYYAFGPALSGPFIDLSDGAGWYRFDDDGSVVATYFNLEELTDAQDDHAGFEPHYFGVRSYPRELNIGLRYPSLEERNSGFGQQFDDDAWDTPSYDRPLHVHYLDTQQARSTANLEEDMLSNDLFPFCFCCDVIPIQGGEWIDYEFTCDDTYQEHVVVIKETSGRRIHGTPMSATCSVMLTIEDPSPPIPNCAEDLTFEAEVDNWRWEDFVPEITGGDVCGLGFGRRIYELSELDAAAKIRTQIDTQEIRIPLIYPADGPTPAKTLYQWNCPSNGNNETVRILATVDTLGEPTSCTTTVVVQDTLAPEFECFQGDIALHVGDQINFYTVINGGPAVDIGDRNAGVFDACLRYLNIDPHKDGNLLAGNPQEGSVFVTLGCQHRDPTEHQWLMTAVDVGGRSSSCTVNVTVTVDQDPTITCKSVSAFNAEVGSEIVYSTFVEDGSEQPLCGDIESRYLTTNPTDAGETAQSYTFGCDDIGTSSAIYAIAVDGDGNDASCSASVTITDSTPPTLTCGPPLSWQADAATGIFFGDLADASDNCPNHLTTEFTIDRSSKTLSSPTITTGNSWTPLCSERGNVYTATVTAVDAGENLSSCTTEVTVVDNNKPNVNCFQTSVTFEVFDSFTVNQFASVSDTCDTSLVAMGSIPADSNPTFPQPSRTFGGSPTDFNCEEKGEWTMYLTAMDNDGNSGDASCSVTITVLDSTAPKVNINSDLVTAFITNPQDPKEFQVGTVLADNTGIYTGSDNCGYTSSFEWNAQPISSLGCALASPLGDDNQIDITPQTVTVILTDAAGNVGSKTAVVQVLDSVAPEVFCRSDTQQTYSVGELFGIDNIAEFIQNPNFINVGPASKVKPQGEDTEEFIRHDPTDNCGVLQRYWDLGLSGQIGQADAADRTSFSATQTLGCDSSTVNKPVELTRIWALDAAGNVDSCQVEIVVEDTTKPVATCPSGTVSIDVGIIDAGNVQTLATDDFGASDNCPGEQGSLSKKTYTCNDLPAVRDPDLTEVSWTVVDTSQNEHTCTAAIEVVDKTAPQLNCLGNVVIRMNGTGVFYLAVREPVDDNGDETSVPSYMRDLFFAQPVDVCGVATTGILAEGGDVNNPLHYAQTRQLDCSHIGTTLTVIAAAWDTTGNKGTCSVTVDVKDAAGPILECPQALDSPGGNGLVVPLDVESTSDTMTLTEQVLSLTIIDVCDPSPLTTTFRTVKDAKNPGNLDHLTCNDASHIVTVSITTTDSSGNAASCNMALNVQDQTPPSVDQCNNYIVNGGAANQADRGKIKIGRFSSFTLSPDTYFPEWREWDNCGMETAIAQPTTVGCNHVNKLTPITLTLRDKRGNPSTCTTTVTVIDDTPPELICRNPTTIPRAALAGQRPIDYILTAQDTCTVQSSTYAFVGTDGNSEGPTLDCSHFQEGSATVSLVGYDPSGNAGTCTTTIHLSDVNNVQLTCRDSVVMEKKVGTLKIGTAIGAGQRNIATNLICDEEVEYEILPSSVDTCGSPVDLTVTAYSRDDTNNRQKVARGSCTVPASAITFEDTQLKDITCSSTTFATRQEIDIGETFNSQSFITNLGAVNADECNPVTVAPVGLSFTCADLLQENGGSNRRITVTVTDSAAHTSTCGVRITIVDKFNQCDTAARPEIVQAAEICTDSTIARTTEFETTKVAVPSQSIVSSKYTGSFYVSPPAFDTDGNAMRNIPICVTTINFNAGVAGHAGTVRARVSSTLSTTPAVIHTQLYDPIPDTIELNTAWLGYLITVEVLFTDGTAATGTVDYAVVRATAAVEHATTSYTDTDCSTVATNVLADQYSWVSKPARSTGALNDGDITTAAFSLNGNSLTPYTTITFGPTNVLLCSAELYFGNAQTGDVVGLWTGQSDDSRNSNAATFLEYVPLTQIDTPDPVPDTMVIASYSASEQPTLANTAAGISGVVVSDFSASSGLAQIDNTNFRWKHWLTGTFNDAGDAQDHMSFVIAISGSVSITLTKLEMKFRRHRVAGLEIRVTASFNGGGHVLLSSTDTSGDIERNENVDVGFKNPSRAAIATLGEGDALEIRVTAWGATKAFHWLQLMTLGGSADSIRLTGDVTRLAPDSIDVFKEDFESGESGFRVYDPTDPTSNAGQDLFDDGKHEVFNIFPLPVVDSGRSCQFQELVGGTGKAIVASKLSAHGGSDRRRVEISGISISGQTALQVGVSLAASAPNSVCNQKKFEGNDGVKIYYVVDGGSETLAGEFKPNGSPGNLKLEGGTTELGYIFQRFDFNIATSGTTLTIIVEISVAGFGEVVAVDDIRVSIPAPAVPSQIKTTNVQTLNAIANRLRIQPVTTFLRPTELIAYIKKPTVAAGGCNVRNGEQLAALDYDNVKAEYKRVQATKFFGGQSSSYKYEPEAADTATPFISSTFSTKVVNVCGGTGVDNDASTLAIELKRFEEGGTLARQQTIWVSALQRNHWVYLGHWTIDTQGGSASRTIYLPSFRGKGIQIHGLTDGLGLAGIEKPTVVVQTTGHRHQVASKVSKQATDQLVESVDNHTTAEQAEQPISNSNLSLTSIVGILATVAVVVAVAVSLTTTRKKSLLPKATGHHRSEERELSEV